MSERIRVEGMWISNNTAQPFRARKRIMLALPVTKAEARVCGLGQFVFYVNGKKVSDHELDPGWTDYRKYIEFVTFDITGMLHPGENELSAEVGNGWYIMDDADGYSFHFPAFMPPNPNPYRPFGKTLVLKASVAVTYEDGTQEFFGTDESWETAQDEVLHSNVYGSEIADGSVGLHPDWHAATVVPEEDCPRAPMVEQFQPAVKVIHSYSARFLHEVQAQKAQAQEVQEQEGKEASSGSRQIYDLGQNCSFLLSFEVRGKKGDVVRFYPAEKLTPEGDADQMAKNWMMIDDVVTYIIGEDDTWESYRQKFTYLAGRYLAVEKSRPDIEVRDITGDAITSAWENSGSFTSDDERYNKIYDMIEKTVEANMLSVHTDCPTIERFAWQEPNHLMGAAIMYMKNGRKLWEKFFTDMRAGQHTAADIFHDFEGNVIHPGDGLIPSQDPCYIPNVLPVPGMGSFYDIIPWGSALILGLRWHYLFYGDRRVVEENYDAGMRYLHYLKTKMTPEGFINHGLGDWGNPENELARENIETAFLYADAKTLAEFAEVLEKEEDAASLQNFAKEVRDNYNARLLVRRENGKLAYRDYEHQDRFTMTQACEALPLYWGMVPEEAKEDVVLAFRETLLEKKAFVAGEIGLPYIIQTAREYGMNDLIAEFITRETHPSYYAFILDGETTLGEYWETNPRSHCHDMMGHIIEWYYNGIAGIRPLAPGFRKVEIKPYLPASMNHMRAEFHSASGVITVEQTRDGSGIHVDIHADEGIKII